MFDALTNLVQQVVDLPGGGFNFDGRVQQTGGTNHLFHDEAGFLHLRRSRRRGNENYLIDVLFKFLEMQRSIVQRRWQSETKFDQGFLACDVAVIHTPDLRKRHV